MSNQDMLPFTGFELPKENWSKLPHTVIESLPTFSSMAEIKIVLYILRHTWGYTEYGQAKAITLDEFEHGRKDKDGKRLDSGTGLAKSNIVKGIHRAVEHGFLDVGKDDRDRGRRKRSYRLHMNQGDVSNRNIDVSNQDINGTESIHRTEKETQKDTRGKKDSIVPPSATQPKLPEPVSPIPSIHPIQEVSTSKRLPPPPHLARPAPPPKPVNGKKPGPKPAVKSTLKQGRRPRATDVFWNAIADCFFDGARVGNQRLARILFGQENHGLFGLIAFEVEHQNTQTLDFEMLAFLVPKFKESLPDDPKRTDSRGKPMKLELRDPAKFIERWIGWRCSTGKPIESKKPVLNYDPDCPHRFDTHPCDKGTIYLIDEKGNSYRKACDCQLKILEARKGRVL